MHEILTDQSQLKKQCQSVSIEEGLKIADQLSSALTNSKVPGCGLAANQIGVDARVCIIRIPKKDVQGFEYTVETTFINPIVSDLQTPAKFSGEGCLSFPDKRCQTLRYLVCKVVDDLEPSGRKLSGLAAIAVQHEVDHLNGITMLDRLFETIAPNQPCLCGSQQQFRRCCKNKVKDF